MKKVFSILSAIATKTGVVWCIIEIMIERVTLKGLRPTLSWKICLVPSGLKISKISSLIGLIISKIEDLNQTVFQYYEIQLQSHSIVQLHEDKKNF